VTNKVEKIVLLVAFAALSCPAEAITMTAAERKPDEKHLYREEKYASIYEINMLRCIFAGCVKMHVQKTRLFDYSKTLVVQL
jgi:NADH-quinone oxidoreductase subunit I